MPCRPLMCTRQADCLDLYCPAHPTGAAAYLDEHDRNAAHRTAMRHSLRPPEPVVALRNEHDEADDRIVARKLGPADWVAIAFFLSVIVWALLRLLEII